MVVFNFKNDIAPDVMCCYNSSQSHNNSAMKYFKKLRCPGKSLRVTASPMVSAELPYYDQAFY